MSRFTKYFEIMVATTLGKNQGPAMPKRSNDSCLQENQELQTTCILPMNFQIYVLNKQLVPHLTEITRFEKHIDGLITDM